MAEQEILTLNAVRREDTGKAAAKRLRNEGTIPGVYYQSGGEATHLQFNRHDVEMLLRKRPTLINLVWGKDAASTHECMIREIQRHPVTHLPTHLDLIGITRGVKITATIQIELVGTPKGVREQGGVLQQALNRVDIICLPRHLPQVITVDVTDMALGEAKHLRDLVVENIEWDESPDQTICTVAMPRVTAEAEEEEAGEEAEAEEEAAAESEESGEE